MFFRVWISEKFRSKELRETQGCKTVLSVFFYLFIGSRFRSFKAGIPRHDKLSRTIFFKKKKNCSLLCRIWTGSFGCITLKLFLQLGSENLHKVQKCWKVLKFGGLKLFWILFRFPWNKDFCNLIKNLRTIAPTIFL